MKLNAFLMSAFIVLAVAGLASADPVNFNLTQYNVFPTAGFNVTNYVQTPDRIYPGDQVRLSFMLVNALASTDMGVQLNALTPFDSAKHQFDMGNMDPGVPKPVLIDFSVPDGTKPGTYYVYVYSYYSKGIQAEMLAQIPFTVNEPNLANALVANIGAIPQANAGETIDVPVNITNVGSLPASDVVVQMKFDTSNAIVPMGADRVYISEIPANSTATADFLVGLSPQATPGFYPMTMGILYKIDKSIQPQVNQTFGLKVNAQTGLLVTSVVLPSSASTASSTSSTTSAAGTPVEITIANTGDTAVRGVYVSATSTDFYFSGTSDKFIGTLNLDDSSTLDLTLIPSATARNGSSAIVVHTSYKDELNAVHTQDQQISISRNGANSAGFSGGNGTAGSNQRFGKTSTNSGLNFFGFSPLEIIGMIAIVILGYFGYKWYARRGVKK